MKKATVQAAAKKSGTNLQNLSASGNPIGFTDTKTEGKGNVPGGRNSAGGLGWHYIADIYTSDSALLNDDEYIKKALITAANEAKVTIIDVSSHHFTPHGVTAFLLLAESHISIHTWPEHGYAALDIFTCGGEPAKALESLKKALKASRVELRSMNRGKL